MASVNQARASRLAWLVASSLGWSVACAGVSPPPAPPIQGPTPAASTPAASTPAVSTPAQPAPTAASCPCACLGAPVELRPVTLSAYEATQGADVESLYMPAVSEQLSQLHITEAALAQALFPPAGDPAHDTVNLRAEHPELPPLPRIAVGSLPHTTGTWSYVTGAQLRVHQLARLNDLDGAPRAVALYSVLNPQDAVYNQLMAEWHVALLDLAALRVVSTASFSTRIAHRDVERWRAIETGLSATEGTLLARVRYLHAAPRTAASPAPLAEQSAQEFTVRLQVNVDCVSAGPVELTRDDYRAPGAPR